MLVWFFAAPGGSEMGLAFFTTPSHFSISTGASCRSCSFGMEKAYHPACLLIFAW